jgi:hypothetical protein
MARPERQQAVLDILSGLKGLEPLKQLFWSELSYQRLTPEEIKIVEGDTK